LLSQTLLSVKVNGAMRTEASFVGDRGKCLFKRPRLQSDACDFIM